LREKSAVRNPYLIGSALYLRPIEPKDIPSLVTWFNDPEVSRTLRRYRPMMPEHVKAFVDRVSQSETDLALAIVVREGDLFIGTTGLHDLEVRHRHVAFGISIGMKTAWGKGYGTEATRLMIRHAFQTLNLNRVSLDVYEFNQRAVRCYEKAGFQLEGRQRQSYFSEGRYWDTIVMGVLREEWRPSE
jgi:diamine N-acetyltransferase